MATDVMDANRRMSGRILKKYFHWLALLQKDVWRNVWEMRNSHANSRIPIAETELFDVWARSIQKAACLFAESVRKSAGEPCPAAMRPAAAHPLRDPAAAHTEGVFYLFSVLVVICRYLRAPPILVFRRKPPPLRFVLSFESVK